jgi:hypothetical protein
LDWKIASNDQFTAMAALSIDRITLYHCTNPSAYQQIIAEGRMRPGQSGMFGPGIYFAGSETAARRKCQHADVGSQCILKVSVDMGLALVLNEPDHSMTGYKLSELGYDSIKGRRCVEAEWEFVIFDANRIRSITPINGPAAGLGAPCISRLAVVARRERSDALRAIPSGLTLHNQDLCQGTKRRGDYVFVAFEMSREPGRAITDIAMEAFDNEATNSEYWENGCTYTRILVDLNSGAHGKWIYLSYTRDSNAGRPIKEIGSDVSGSAGPGTRSGWESVCWRGTWSPADTNLGAGGPYIYLRFRRE